MALKPARFCETRISKTRRAPTYGHRGGQGNTPEQAELDFEFEPVRAGILGARKFAGFRAKHAGFRAKHACFRAKPACFRANLADFTPRRAALCAFC